MRPRSSKYKGLEPNLYYHAPSGLYRYRHPKTGQLHYLSRDKKACIEAARKLNAMLMPASDLVDQVVNPRCRFSLSIDYYRTHKLPKLAEVTIKQHRVKLAKIEAKLSQHDASEISVLDVNDFLEAVSASINVRQLYRSLLKDLFKIAISKGHTTENPAAAVLPNKFEKKRMRLTLDAYQAIYAQAEDQWLRNAMDMALLTLQRRHDLALLRFDQFRDGKLYLTQHKTGQPLVLTAGASLEQVIARCKDDILSPFVIHHLPKKIRRAGKRSTQREHHTQVMPDEFGRAFTEARDAAGLYKKKDNPPTFHEIRSLGADLYRQAGMDEKLIQALLGHRDARTTRIYLDGHTPPPMHGDANLSL